MLVINTIAWAGERFSHKPGDVIDLPDKTANARIDAGLAERAPAGAKVTSAHYVDPPAKEG